MQQKKFLPSMNQIRLFNSLLSASLYSAWVVYRGWDDALLLMIFSGLVQFVISFFSTYVFSSLIGRLVHNSSSLFKAAMAAMLASILYAVVLITGHYLVGTLHLFGTLLPVLMIAIIYAFTFASYQALRNARLVVRDA